MWNDKKRIKDSFNRFYRGLRFMDMLNYTLEENKQRLHTALQTTNGDIEITDRNIEIYRSKMRGYYIKVIEGTELLQSLFGDTKVFRKNEPVIIDLKTMRENFKGYTEKMTDTRYNTIQKEFELDRRYFKDKKKLGYQSTHYMKVILHEAFGMDIKSTTRGSKKLNKNLDIKCLTSEWLFDVIEKYRPFNLRIHEEVDEEYAIVDLEDPLDT